LKRFLPVRHVEQAAWMVIALVGVQIFAGVANLLLLAPIPMQMLHLLLADLLWLALVRLTLEVIHAGNSENKVELKTEKSPERQMRPSMPAV